MLPCDLPANKGLPSQGGKKGEGTRAEKLGGGGGQELPQQCSLTNPWDVPAVPLRKLKPDHEREQLVPGLRLSKGLSYDSSGY